jgi:hypothetical protein
MLEAWMDGWVDRWMAWMDGWVDRWMAWIDGCPRDLPFVLSFVPAFVLRILQFPRGTSTGMGVRDWSRMDG